MKVDTSFVEFTTRNRLPRTPQQIATDRVLTTINERITIEPLVLSGMPCIRWLSVTASSIVASQGVAKTSTEVQNSVTGVLGNDPHANGIAMNPESLQYLWSLVVTVACLLASMTDVMSPNIDNMSGTDVDSMVTLYDEVVRINPANTSVHLRRGMARLSLKEIEKAIADFDAAIRVSPDCATAYLLRGNAWSQLKRPDRAIRDFDEVLRITPDSVTAYLLRGISRIHQHEMSGALADLDEALRIDPDNAAAYAVRAQARAMKGPLELARRDVNKAIQLEPNQVQYYSLRALLWNAQGEVERAILDYDAALQFDGHHVETRWRRACAWYLQREYGNALADLQAVDDVDPRSLPLKSLEEVAHQALTAADSLIGKRDQVEVETTALASAYCDRGRAYSVLERWDNAIDNLNRAIEFDPTHTAAMSLRAQAFLRIEAFDRAINDFTSTLLLHPDDANCWYGRGSAKFSLRDWQGAVEDFTVALRIDPQMMRALVRRGIARHELRDEDRALEDLDRVAKMPAYYIRDPQKSPTGPAHATQNSTLVTINDFNKSSQTFQTALATALGPTQDRLLKGAERTSSQLVIKIEITKNTDSSVANNTTTNQATAGSQFYEICLDPVYVEAFRTRPVCRERRGEWHLAVASYRDAIRLSPQDAWAHRQLAWLFATCPDDDCRSGEEAVRFAQLAVQQTHAADQENRATLAAAYAELGDWPQAIQWQSLARELAVEVCEKQCQSRREFLQGLDFQRSLSPLETVSSDGSLPVTVQAVMEECRESAWLDVKAIEKLADAYADAGQLELALESQRKATELIEAQRDKPHFDRLLLYRRQQAFRDQTLRGEH